MVNNKSFKKEFKNVSNPPKAVGGIDTLYYFAGITGDNYSKIYYEKIVNGEFFEGFDFLGFSGKSSGFVGAWFSYSVPLDIKVNGKEAKVTLFRIGFKDPNKQKNVKNAYIQLYAEGIYYYGLEELILFIDELLRGYGFIIDGYQVSRADINLFTNYDFSNISKEMFKVPSRSVNVITNSLDDEEVISVKDKKVLNLRDVGKVRIFYRDNKLETIYFGSRASDINLKIYDKSKELSKNDMSVKTFIVREYFKNKGFDENDCVWNVEFSLKRKGLLSYGVNTLSDLLKKAGSIFKDLMDRYVFLGYDVDKIEKYRKSRNLSRLKAFWVWEFLRDSYDRFNYLPVKREIKKYKKIAVDKQLEKIATFIADVEYNTGMSIEEILREVFNRYGFMFFDRRFFKNKVGFNYNLFSLSSR